MLRGRKFRAPRHRLPFVLEIILSCHGGCLATSICPSQRNLWKGTLKKFDKAGNIAAGNTVQTKKSVSVAIACHAADVYAFIAPRQVSDVACKVPVIIEKRNKSFGNIDCALGDPSLPLQLFIDSLKLLLLASDFFKFKGCFLSIFLCDLTLSDSFGYRATQGRYLLKIFQLRLSYRIERCEIVSQETIELFD